MKGSFTVRWVVNCAAGEFFGIAVAAALAVAGNFWIGEPVTVGQKIIILALALFSGTIEGSVLSWFQWRVMKERFGSVPLVLWWRNTVLVAIAGWFLGMVPSLFLIGESPVTETPVEPPMGLVLPGAAALGLVLGAFFGWGQWLVLRRYADRSGRWITLNSLGWMAGMVFIFFAATWPDAQTPVGWTIVSGMAGGLLAGLSVGVATSRFFRE